MYNIVLEKRKILLLTSKNLEGSSALRTHWIEASRNFWRDKAFIVHLLFMFCTWITKKQQKLELFSKFSSCSNGPINSMQQGQEWKHTRRLPYSRKVPEKKDKKTTLHLLHYTFHCTNYFMHYYFHCTNCICNIRKVVFLSLFLPSFPSGVVFLRASSLPGFHTFYRSIVTSNEVCTKIYTSSVV